MGKGLVVVEEALPESPLESDTGAVLLGDQHAIAKGQWNIYYTRAKIKQKIIIYITNQSINE